jgi:protein-L-isoaspartate(D-aspartate) O-methyltransferase
MANKDELALRQAMVAALQAKGELTDPQMRAAFLSVARHRFLPDVDLEKAYEDVAVPIKWGPDKSVLSSVSQPTMIAMMLRQLALREGDNVLEIGAGAGYNAALMQQIVGDDGHITTVELDHDLVSLASENLQRVATGNNIRLVNADGASGYAPRASYDRIISTVGVWDVFNAWVQQLKPLGVLVAPLWLDSFQVSAAFRLEADNTLYSEQNFPCAFVRMRGIGAGPNVLMRVASSSLTLVSNRIHQLDGVRLHMLMSEGFELSLLDMRLSAGAYWSGLFPYLILNLPADFTFATYHINADDKAYGLSDTGFALIRGGSACFVPFNEHGAAYSYGDIDAFMVVQSLMNAWHEAGRPGVDRLRVRLTPIEKGLPNVQTGGVFKRQDHIVHVWLDEKGG